MRVGKYKGWEKLALAFQFVCVCITSRNTLLTSNSQITMVTTLFLYVLASAHVQTHFWVESRWDAMAALTEIECLWMVGLCTNTSCIIREGWSRAANTISRIVTQPSLT